MAARPPGGRSRRRPDLDRFHVDGREAFGDGGDDRATDLALLPDGRIVTARLGRR